LAFQRILGPFSCFRFCGFGFSTLGILGTLDTLGTSSYA